MYLPDVELEATIRDAYRAVRRHGSPWRQAKAFLLWRRCYGPKPTTFYVAGDGTAWRNDRAALLAELRILMLRQGMPMSYVGRFDRPIPASQS